MKEPPYKGEMLFGFYACGTSLTMPRRFLMDAALYGSAWHHGMATWVIAQRDECDRTGARARVYGFVGYLKERYPQGSDHFRGQPTVMKQYSYKWELPYG